MISETKMRWENENCEGKRREERLNLKEGCVVLCCVVCLYFNLQKKQRNNQLRKESYCVQKS